MCIDDVNIHYVFLKSLGRGEQFPCDTGKLSVNFEKNRVQNTLPCKLSVSLISSITTGVRSVGPTLYVKPQCDFFYLILCITTPL